MLKFKDDEIKMVVSSDHAQNSRTGDSVYPLIAVDPMEPKVSTQN